MPKPVSPLVGYNNNVRHKGRIFHVQTEDSGVSRPRILTHLFADGGRIVKSTRTDYSEHVGREDIAQVVRGLMKEQHKAMFIALRDGKFDEAIDQISLEGEGEGVVSPPELGEALPSPPPSRLPTSPPSRPPTPRRPAPTMPEMVAVAPPVLLPDPDRAPLQRRPAPTLQGVSLADVGAPSDHALSPVLDAVARRAPTGHTPRYGTPAIQPQPGAEVRYGGPRPAAIFQNQTQPEGGSIFGSVTVSEQSLDEVILSYLAEDLEPTKP